MDTKYFPDIERSPIIRAMPKNDRHINENHWRHRHLLRKRQVHRMPRLGVILFVLAVLVMLGWWLELPPSSLIGKGIS